MERTGTSTLRIISSVVFADLDTSQAACTVCADDHKVDVMITNNLNDGILRLNIAADHFLYDDVLGRL